MLTMACVANLPSRNADSEMEEGEIVDDLDDLSDISSEEEFLLRQRLEVLESYNNVLERKKAKSSVIGAGIRNDHSLLRDLSEVSATDLEDVFPKVSSNTNIVLYKNVKVQRHVKPQHKQKKKRDVAHKVLGRNKNHKKRANRKKKLELKVLSESSDESDDEYRNKRKKLADAVVVNKDKNDTSSLHARLQNMLSGAKAQGTTKAVPMEDKETETDNGPKLENVSCSPIVPLTTVDPNIGYRSEDNILSEIKQSKPITELVDLCTDDDCTIMMNEEPKEVDSVKDIAKVKTTPETDSDEDLELLRQDALKTKTSKVKLNQAIVSADPVSKPPILSEDEDSDTAELRLICLKSALLKKAIEMKQNQKLRKRLSQSSNLQDELLNEQIKFLSKSEGENNSTDIESVDMDIGSDGDEKVKDFPNDCCKTNQFDSALVNKIFPKPNVPKEDELEEDEDLLRAKLLTSLSKNLPNLVDPNILNNIERVTITDKSVSSTKNKVNVPEEKRIVINLGESDSEGEHEATKNLTKMHMKLSEQIDFQQKLDMFLKSTRMEVEKKTLPDVVQEPVVSKHSQKFVAKAVNNLPKSEQIEYKNLVKRMAELEKIKQVRHSSMNLMDKLLAKETLKPRNFTGDSSQLLTVVKLEDRIASSRKVIAEESAKMLNLKEEAKKLSQKYKIAATELRNITTAITFNKKQQRSVQNRLSKIRIQHQRLLNSSSSNHSKTNGQVTLNNLYNKIISTTKLQKENDPSKEDYKGPHSLQSVKVSVVNELKDEKEISTPRLSVQFGLSSNKKAVKIPNNEIDIQRVSIENDKGKMLETDTRVVFVEKFGGRRRISEEINTYNEKTDRRKEFNDYESPLQALDTASWAGDPNAILCPFEVGGNCKDPDCEYLHPKIPSKQLH